MVLVFEIFAVPNIVSRLGVRTSQRLGSVFEIPVYLLVPLLSRVNAAGLPVTAAAIFLLFTCTVGTNAVSVFSGVTGWDSFVKATGGLLLPSDKYSSSVSGKLIRKGPSTLHSIESVNCVFA